MFKKFVPEDVSGESQVKTSVARGVRNKIVEQFPNLEAYIDDIIPKKAPLHLAKCPNYLSLVVLEDEVLFFNVKNGPFFPTLKLLHKYPEMMPSVQVDKGAIKYLLGGANIMCPGLTHPSARMDVSLPAETVVAIKAEGKEHALAVALLQMSTDDIRSINKGNAAENVHFLGDGLWKNTKLR
eukprot:TRINITY_DN6416_c0_g1_i1.p1 TRINITY_DN6416_c0_g1~~TRINITY_DN6416_c0_g1_i1.p1  ORF type:complete len:197 (+),score=87.99 TRINITY_DN6416_c0_g1_i1:48-593(+)